MAPKAAYGGCYGVNGPQVRFRNDDGADFTGWATGAVDQ
jgi:hypothetical protein